MILSDLQAETLNRIEENGPAGDPPGPTFWSLTGEVYPQMVDAMFEAALLTGVVQKNAVNVTLTAETTYFTLPQGVISPIRLRAPYPVRKVTLAGLDMITPNWQQAEPASQIQAWFPLGVTMFGIYPELEVETDVTMDFIYSPVNEARPYTGGETIPFPDQFNDFISMYAAAVLRCKEGGAEAEEASVVFDQYLAQMKDLSLFQSRINSLVLGADFGGKGPGSGRKQV